MQLLAFLPLCSLALAAPTHLGALTQSKIDSYRLAAAPIFGNYAPCVGEYCSWMKDHDDSVKLSAMNLPGVHDAATWNYTQTTAALLFPITGPVAPSFFFRCQTLDFYDVLALGVRVFDLRVGLAPAPLNPMGTQSQDVLFWHATALLSDTATLQDVLYSFYAWLEENPSEALVLTIKIEHGTIDENITSHVYDALNTPEALSFFLQTLNVIPTLGEARGKILLGNRFDSYLPGQTILPAADSNRYGLMFTPTFWVDNGANSTVDLTQTTPGASVGNPGPGQTVYIEDYFNIQSDGPVNQGTPQQKIQWKFNATSYHLDLASSPAHQDSLFISFASAVANINVPPIYPEIMALGYPELGIDGIDQILLTYLTDSTRAGNRFGIVMLDWVGSVDGLVAAVIGRAPSSPAPKHTPTPPKCTGTTTSVGGGADRSAEKGDSKADAAASGSGSTSGTGRAAQIGGASTTGASTGGSARVRVGR